MCDFQIWVRKTSDSTKMRIYLGQLQRGAFVIRRRSAAWNITTPNPICAFTHPSSQWLIHPVLESNMWPHIHISLSYIHYPLKHKYTQTRSSVAMNISSSFFPSLTKCYCSEHGQISNCFPALYLSLCGMHVKLVCGHKDDLFWLQIFPKQSYLHLSLSY